MFCDGKSFMFVIDDLKFIKMFSTSNHCFKPLSSVHNIAFFSEKVLIWNRREIFTDQALFTSKKSPKQPYTNILVDFDVIGQKGMDFLSFF